MLYEAVTGRHPFYASDMTHQELRRAVCESAAYAEQDEFQGLPTRWRILLKRTLAKDRATRPSSGKKAAQLLRKMGSET
jgi:hypothetical protein